MFAGTAQLTLAMRTAGVICPPPIQKCPGEAWFKPTNAFSHEEKIKNWIRSGAVRFLHCGTECKTFSSARKFDGRGPPPIRCPETLAALATCSKKQRADVELGTSMAQMSCNFAKEMTTVGQCWTIENPDTSLIWKLPEMRDLIAKGAFFIEFPMCAWGSLSMKPTKVLSNWVAGKEHLNRKCPGTSWPHIHFPLQGTFKHPKTGEETFHTKVAQEYPARLVQQWARSAAATVFQEYAQTPSVMCKYGSQFGHTFNMVAPGTRKQKNWTPLTDAASTARLCMELLQRLLGVKLKVPGCNL